MNKNFYSTCKEFLGSMIYSYLLMMFSLFLFYFRNHYFNITSSKYSFFATATLLLIGICMLGSIYLRIREKPKNAGIKAVVHSLSITDWAFLIMLVSHIITTLISEYQMESLTGSQGRQMGLNFTFLLTSMYFLVSRWYRQEQSIILIFLGSVGIVSILGMLNFYNYDPFHFFDLLTSFDVQRFISTIGNITFFANLICLSLPLSIFLYSYCEQKQSKIIYGSSMIVGFMSIYISNLDGAYLGMIAFFIFFFIIMCTSYEQFKKFLSILLVALISAKLLYIISVFLPSRGFVTISYAIVASDITSITLLVLSIIYVLYNRYADCLKTINYRKIRWIVFTIALLCILSILAMMLYFSFVDTTIDIGSLDNYIRFSDDWGTGRGFIWNRLLPLYTEQFTYIEKLFGSGLDTTRMLMVSNFTSGDIGAYDNAHNEYIQYLVTSGLIGLSSYLVLFFSQIYRLLKSKLQDPICLGIAGCLIAHGAQAITGLNQPITTPILFILIAIGENHLRSRKKEIV